MLKSPFTCCYMLFLSILSKYQWSIPTAPLHCIASSFTTASVDLCESCHVPSSKGWEVLATCCCPKSGYHGWGQGWALRGFLACHSCKSDALPGLEAVGSVSSPAGLAIAPVKLAEVGRPKNQMNVEPEDRLGSREEGGNGKSEGTAWHAWNKEKRGAGANRK